MMTLLKGENRVKFG